MVDPDNKSLANTNRSTNHGRRDVLRLIFSGACVKGIGGTAGLASALMAPAAWASPTAALAIASIVSRMMADSNRRSVVALKLDATGAQVRLAVSQLVSLQASVAAIYESLENLPGEIRKIHIHRETEDFRRRISGVIKDYGRAVEVERESEFNSGSAFFHDYKEELLRLVERLEPAVAEFQESENSNSPSAAVLIPAAAFIHYGIYARLGRSNAKLADTIDRYIAWFDQILDSDTPSSTAAFLRATSERHDQLMADTASTLLGRKLRMQPGFVIADCVGINDTTPRRTAIYGDGRYAIRKNVPRRHGMNDRLWKRVGLAEKEYVPTREECPTEDIYEEAKNGSGLIFLHLPEEMEDDFRAEFEWGKPERVREESFPGNGSCGIETMDQRSSTHRLSHMKNSAAWKRINAEVMDFRRRLGMINECRSNFAFAHHSIESVEQAREQLIIMRRNLAA